MKLAGAPAIAAKAGVLPPLGTKETMSATKEPIPAPIAAGRGPATIAKKTGMTIPGLNSPIPQGVRRVEVKASNKAYSAAQIAAFATNFDLFITISRFRNLPRNCELLVY